MDDSAATPSPGQIQDVIDIDPSGDLLLRIRDNGAGIDFEYRVSTAALRKASHYFHVLLDPSKFSEGIAVGRKLKEIRGLHEGTETIPLLELPMISIPDIGQIPQGTSTKSAVELLLHILHNEDTPRPSPRPLFVTLLAIVADRFAAKTPVANYVIQQKWKNKLATQKSSSSPPELRVRQLLLVGLILRFPDWVRQYSATLIVQGSEKWRAQCEEVQEDEPLWWNLPNGLEEELLCRRHYVLETISSLQHHFTTLYASKQPQCRLGYDSSPQCDSFQLGEMIRFFTRKGLLHLQSTFAEPTDNMTYPGTMTDLLDTLRECPTYQIDRNHTHCGLRSRFYPALEFIKPLSQAGVCLHCWKDGQDSWIESPTGGMWSPITPRLMRPSESCRDHLSFKAMYTAEKRDWTPAPQQSRSITDGAESRRYLKH